MMKRVVAIILQKRFLRYGFFAFHSIMLAGAVFNLFLLDIFLLYGMSVIF